MLRLGMLGMALSMLVFAAAPAQTAPEVPPTPEATVYFSFNPRGDVQLTIYADELSQRRLEALRSVALPCDWRPGQVQDGYLDGTCHGLVHSDGASVDGRVLLVALVAGLRAYGIGTVKFSARGFADFRSSPGKGWYISQGTRRRKRAATDRSTYYYTSYSGFDFPVYADIQIGTPWSAAQFVTPLAFTLFGPPLLALWLRVRSARKGRRPAAVVWMSWVLNGVFLYWISALSMSDLTAFTWRLRVENVVATVAVGGLIYCIPPLLSVMACVFLTHTSGDKGEAMTMAFRAAIQNSTFLVPLAIFLVGTGMLQIDPRVGGGSVLAAYAVYKMLALVAARMTHGNIQKLTQGDLYQSVTHIAARASVKLHGFYLTDNRSKREVNAFASGTGVVMVSRGLVENLTRREVDCVLAHETGHLRGKHTLMTVAGFWMYILVLQPMLFALAITAHVPKWVLSLPVLPMAYILGTAFLSRGREFNADKRAAELTGDPLGVIAGLARLRMLSDTPVDWGGIQGSILSHPSMRARVLAIARHFQMDEGLALAVLHNPDTLNAVGAEAPKPLHYELPQRSVLFSAFAKEGYSIYVRWAMNVVLVAELISVGVVLSHVELPWWCSALAFLAGLALTVRTFLAVDAFLSCRFLNRIRRKLEKEQRGAEAPTMFVGVLPGWQVSMSEGYPIWDVGFLSFAPDYITYQGEQTRFSIPREAVMNLAIQKGPLYWDPCYVVNLVWQGGSVSLTRPDHGTSSRQARRLERQLRIWWQGEPLPEPWLSATAPLPMPQLPDLPVAYMHGWKAFRTSALRAAMLFMGTILLLQAVQTAHHHNYTLVMLPLLAPLCYMLAVCPVFFRKPAA